MKLMRCVQASAVCVTTLSCMYAAKLQKLVRNSSSCRAHKRRDASCCVHGAASPLLPCSLSCLGHTVARRARALPTLLSAPRRLSCNNHDPSFVRLRYTDSHQWRLSTPLNHRAANVAAAHAEGAASTRLVSLSLGAGQGARARVAVPPRRQPRVWGVKMCSGRGRVQWADGWRQPAATRAF